MITHKLRDLLTDLRRAEERGEELKLEVDTEKLRELRGKIPLRRIAKLARVSTQTVSLVERGELAKIGYTTLSAVLDVYYNLNRSDSRG